MNDNATAAQNGTDPRPRYLALGEDAKGAHHVYRTVDETVLVIQDGAVVWREAVVGVDDGVDQWVAHIADARGWSTREYFVDVADWGAALAAGDA